MGKVETTIADVLISEVPDRNANRIRIYRMENGEVIIHFRNFKIMLLTPQEITEWRNGFAFALEELRMNDYLKNDI